MFSEAGNLAIAAMVATARLKTRSEDEASVLAWIKAERNASRPDTGTYPYLPHLRREPGEFKTGHREVFDTMVRETISYALDEAWEQAYGHRFGEGS